MNKKKIALVTGASRGIGKAITDALVSKGYFVVANYVSEKEFKIIENSKEKNIDYFRADITKREDVNKIRKYIRKKYNKIYLLVNNAGVMLPGKLEKIKDRDFDKTIDVNLRGTYNVTKAMIDLIENNGRIINISSIAGIYGEYGLTAYCSSKAGLIGFSKSLSLELARRGITVNAVAPGMINTSLTKDIDKDIRENIISRIPLGKFGEADDVANLVVYLASDKARYITRQVICVDGGFNF